MTGEVRKRPDSVSCLKGGSGAGLQTAPPFEEQRMVGNRLTILMAVVSWMIVAAIVLCACAWSMIVGLLGG